MRGWTSLEILRQDVRYAFRIARGTPGFTAVVILTLALGIGANSALFSILEAVLLQPLPYRNPDRLVAIWDREIHARGVSKLFDLYSDYENWKQNSRSFEQVAALSWAPQASPQKILTGRGPARTVLAVPVTADFFSLLGVPPALGRTFHETDVHLGCRVVLSHKFWQAALGGQNAIGQSLRLDNQACVILGVMPPGFAFYPDAAAMWMLMPPPSRPDQFAVGVFARRKPGVSISVAQAEALSLHRQFHQHDLWGAQMEPVIYDLHDEFTWLTGRNLRLSLLVLFGAVTFVLLICCVNVANLLLGRSLMRQREMAIRAALGSGRSRLARQVLTESLLLSFVASIAGAGLVGACIRYFQVVHPIEMPPAAVVGINGRVLVFTALLSVLTAVLFGVFPAWKASRVDLNETLKTGGKTTSQSFRRHRFGRGLIVAEVMLTMPLLAAAALLIQSIERITSAPLGFAPDGLLIASLKLPRTGYQHPEQRIQFYDRLQTALSEIPGLRNIALSTTRPLGAAAHRRL
jgi:predicted permease